MAKGRDKNLIELRDEALCRRYYYWTEVQRLRFDDAPVSYTHLSGLPGDAAFGNTEHFSQLPVEGIVIVAKMCIRDRKNLLMSLSFWQVLPCKVYGAKLGGLKAFFKPRFHHGDFKGLP